MILSDQQCLILKSHASIHYYGCPAPKSIVITMTRMDLAAIQALFDYHIALAIAIAYAITHLPLF